MIGRPLLRVEDRRLLTGRGRFVDDLRPAGLLHVAFLRSPFPHAQLTSIDTAAAGAQPGVVAVLSGSDLAIDIVPPMTTPDSYSPPRPVLARDLVRFVGEPIAVAVAESRYLAEDALEHVSVEYTQLPVLRDAISAQALGAPSLHAWPTNVLFKAQQTTGPVDRAFQDAAAVVEATFHNPRYAPAPIEARGALALIEHDILTLWSSTQAPHRTHSLLAEVLELDAARIRVIAADVGGGFGQKAHTCPEEVVVCALALRLGRPIKWVEDRSENLIAATHARDQAIWARAAADGDGLLTAIEADVTCDVGAYGVYPHGHALEAMGTPSMIPGPYRLSTYRAHSRAVATNKCPEGAYRGVGLPVAVFVHERLMDMLAARLGMDRAEIRRRNFVRPADLPYATVTGQRYDSGDYGKALDLALAAVGYEDFPTEREAARAEGRRLGLGIASYVEYSAMGSAVFRGRGMIGISGHDDVHVELDSNSHVVAWTTMPNIGQGVDTTFAQVIAAELDLPFETIRVEHSDSGIAGLSGTGAFASRSAVAGGGALVGACTEIRRRLLEDASQRLEVAPYDLELAAGWVKVVGLPDRGIPIGQLVRAAEESRYKVSARFDPPQATYPYGTHACVVQVDVETGAVKILRYAVADDCGTVINPLIVEGQVHGAVAQGIGGAIYEEILYDAEGQLITGSLVDYLLPTALDIPELNLSHLEIPSPHTVTGSKGVGEGGTLAPAAALANAVADALGVDLNDLPLTPERVAEAARVKSNI